MTEFSGAFMIFILFIFVPLINIGILPVRYLLAHGAMSEMAHRMAVCEKRSDAAKLLADNKWWSSFLTKCGASVKDPSGSLIVVGNGGGSKTTVGLGTNLPEDKLPNSAQGPYMYSVQLNCDCDIAPLFNAHAGLPGFTKPITFKMSSQAQWENLGRDPQTLLYYINE